MDLSFTLTSLFCDSGFLRSDKPIGTAQLKLEKLEAESEVREMVEVRGLFFNSMCVFTDESANISCESKRLYVCICMCIYIYVCVCLTHERELKWDIHTH